jgi:hypothetical protein
MSDLVKDMLDNVIMDNNADAEQEFRDVMAAKMTDALDQRKIEIAQSMGANDAEVQDN